MSRTDKLTEFKIDEILRAERNYTYDTHVCVCVTHVQGH